MNVKARVEWDINGVRIATGSAFGEDRSQVRLWDGTAARVLEPGEDIPHEGWLRLPEDEARAIYESLAEYFGHSVHDTRALRKDYEAERARVDRLIDAVVAK